MVVNSPSPEKRGPFANSSDSIIQKESGCPHRRLSVRATAGAQTLRHQLLPKEVAR